MKRKLKLGHLHMRMLADDLRKLIDLVRWMESDNASQVIRRLIRDKHRETRT